MTYKECVNKTIKSIILDFGSFRCQLIYWAYVYNFAVLFLVASNKLDWKAIHIAIGLLLAIYYHYFKSKAAENMALAVNSDPPTERDPDKVPQ